jgi:hypothetical protein
MFRILLHDFELTPLSRLDELASEPQTKVLIVLGEADVLDRVPGGLENFVRAGGALLFASDRVARQNSLVPFGYFVSGSRMSGTGATVFGPPGASDECIKIKSNLPQAAPLFTTTAKDGKIRDIEVVTNRAGYLERILTNASGSGRPARANPAPGTSVRGLPLLANFPSGTVVKARTFSPGPWAFAAGGDFGKGRALLLSDHSVFINALLWQPATDNRDFAYQCVAWLTEGKRTHALFVEEGELQTAFPAQLAEPPRPPLPPLDRVVQSVDQAIQGMEEEDRFNPILTDLVQRIGPDRLARGLLLTVAGLVGVYALSWLSQARQRFERGLTLPRGGAGGAGPRESVLTERNLALVAGGNYWEVAREQARRFFDDVWGAAAVAAALGRSSGTGPPPLPDSSPSTLHSPLPTLHSPGGWWQRWARGRQVERLWRLAYGPGARPVSPRRLRRIQAELKGLRAILKGV